MIFVSGPFEFCFLHVGCCQSFNVDVLVLHTLSYLEMKTVSEFFSPIVSLTPTKRFPDTNRCLNLSSSGSSFRRPWTSRTPHFRPSSSHCLRRPPRPVASASRCAAWTTAMTTSATTTATTRRARTRTLSRLNSRSRKRTLVL